MARQALARQQREKHPYNSIRMLYVGAQMFNAQYRKLRCMAT